MIVLISGWWFKNELTKKIEISRIDIINNSNNCNDLYNQISNLEEKIHETTLNVNNLLIDLKNKIEINADSPLDKIDNLINEIKVDVKEKIKQLNETADKLTKDFEKKDMKNDSLLFQKFFKSPTPANFAEIMALWPYLSDESKIIFFIEKSNKKDLRCLVNLMNELCILALKSPNPYIRYLAAKEYMFGFNISKHLDYKAQSIIQKDSHHLVKYLHLEDKYSSWGPEKEEFKTLLQLDHQARLAIVKSGEINGGNLADLISYFCSEGLPTKKISEMEIYEIIHTYISNDRFIWNYTQCPNNGYGAFCQTEELKKLWKLIPVVSKQISLLLIEKLPSQDGNYFDVIPEEILENMDKSQITQLLYRSDVVLEEFRKKMFHKIYNDSNHIDKYDDFLLAVVSHHFDLKINPICFPIDPILDDKFNDEFLQILQLPKDSVLKILCCLLQSKDCNPVILFASGDYLLHQDFDDDWWKRDFTNIKKKIHDNIEKGSICEDTVRNLRLYTLAKKIMPWGENEPQSTYLIDTTDLRFLLSHIKRGKTWETYQAFYDAWLEKHWRYKDELLPKVSKQN